MTKPAPLPTAEKLHLDWNNNPRWQDVQRPYSGEDVARLRGTVHVEHSLARHGAERLWRELHAEPFVNALGALTGNQAMQQVKAGLRAIYVSGWQVAADANSAGAMYPDQSLYPADSVPEVVRRINNTLLRADQIAHAEGNDDTDWLAPIVADAEAGFGGGKGRGLGHGSFLEWGRRAKALDTDGRDESGSSDLNRHSSVFIRSKKRSYGVQARIQSAHTTLVIPGTEPGAQ